MGYMRKSTIGWLVLCGFVLAGCSTGNGADADKKTEKVFNVAVQQEMPSADLSVATDTISFTALNNVYEGIYRLDAENKPQPAGASELATVSEDGLTYTIKLRDNAKWSNGDPVTAADYVYGWQRTVDPKTASEYAYLFESVENASDIVAGKKAVDQLGIKAVDDHTLEIKLAKATPYFQYLLAFPSFFPQNQKVVEENGDKYATASDKSVYNGPFTLTDFDGPGTDTTWSYTKNPEYWDKKNVDLDKINVSVIKESSTALNLFKDGQADDVILSGELAQQMANDEAFVSEEDGRTSYLEYNQRKEDSPFRNANLRQAISYSLDRDALIKNVLGDGSIASTGLIPKNLTFGPDGTEFTEAAGTLVSYDPEKAKEYWTKAKQELGIDSLTFDIIASDDDSTKKVVEYIQNAVQEQLDGVKVTVSPVPFAVRLDRSSAGDFDVVMGGWGADYADASSFTDLFVTGNSYNRGQWSNPEYDQLVEASGTTDVADPDKRWQDLLGAEKVIMEQQGVTPVFQKAQAHLRNPDFKGVVTHSSGAQYDYKWVKVSE